MPENNSHQPLLGIRIIDMANGKGETCGRILADLGADVILVEPPEGLSSRRLPPLYGDDSLWFLSHNANKRSVVIDPSTESGKATFLALVDSADILIESTAPDTTNAFGLSVAMLREQKPDLIVLSISDFGQTGPYKNYRASNLILLAMAGVLARSGIEDQRPLLPPGELALETTAIQAAWVVLLAYWQRLHTGMGDHLDFSNFEATAQILDPGLGVTGSAAAGRSANEIAPYGRPPVGKLYPIFPCADGYVRICVLNPRQWQGMCAWLGDDHEFTDPIYGNISKRFAVIEKINTLIAALFLDKTGDKLVQEGQSRSVPIAVVSTPQQVLSNPHFNARGAFRSVQMADGTEAKIPSGFMQVDGTRVGLRRLAPALGEHTEEVISALTSRASVKGLSKKDRRPFEGIRVLDLGVIVAGAELGRIFADQGAEVIKIENSAFPDGLRQSSANVPVSQSFAQGSRNKLSFGLNLRSKEGIKIFYELVKKSDIIMSNFKPGTMESLGIGYQQLREINQGIICVESSALGNTGPLAKSMGYGPLVRASSGLTGLWCYPEIPNSYSDSITIFPDHFAARVAGIGVAAALIKRAQTGVGSHIVVSQAETILNTMATPFLRESLQPGSFKPMGNQIEFDAPSSVFQCLGDDLWCAIEVQNDDDFKRLCQAIAKPEWLSDERYRSSQGRVLHREQLEQELAEWTATCTPHEVMTTLQAHGVIASNMQRLSEFDQNPHFQERKFFRHFEQPGFPGVLQTENAPVSFSNMPEPDIKPAPLQGQHTRQLAEQLLGYSPQKIDILVEDGILEPMQPNEFVSEYAPQKSN